MAGRHLIESKPFIHDQNIACAIFLISKGSTELSTLCTTKFNSTSESRISIGTLTYNKLLQIEGLGVSGGWQNSTKLAGFFQLGKIQKIKKKHPEMKKRTSVVCFYDFVLFKFVFWITSIGLKLGNYLG